MGRVTETLATNTLDEMWLRTTHTYDPYSGLKTETEAWGDTLTASNAVNRELGYKEIEIYSPREVTQHEDG